MHELGQLPDVTRAKAGGNLEMGIFLAERSGRVTLQTLV